MNKILLSLLFVLSLFVITQNAEAVVVHAQWQDNSSSYELNQGESAYFDAGAFSVYPPIIFSIKMFDSSNNLVYTFQDSTFYDYFFSTRYYVTENIYKNTGNYNIVVKGSDAKKSLQTKFITLKVNPKDVNRAPVLDSIGNRNVNENDLLQFTIHANDPDNDNLKYKVENLPSGASFNSITRTFSWTPTYDTVPHKMNLLTMIAQTIFGNNNSKKEFQIKFIVNDGQLSDEEEITIIVYDVNRDPVLQNINDITVTEGQLVKISPSASDADNDDLEFRFGFPLNDNGEWQTQKGDAGIYDVSIFVYDDFGGLDSQVVTIKVLEKDGNGENHAPILNPIGDKNIRVNKLLEFTVSATDQDNDPIFFRVENLPSGATFNSNTRKFSWTPKQGQEGTYRNVKFIVSDGKLEDSEAITIKVFAEGEVIPTGVSKEHDFEIISVRAEIEGKNTIVYVYVRNLGSFEEENIKINLIAPDFDIMEFRNIDLDKRENQLLIFELPLRTEQFVYVTAHNRNDYDLKIVNYV